MSEGILSKKQVEDSETWVSYLSKEYDLSKELIKNNFEVVTTMSEEQMQATIQLLKDLITYNLAIYEANKAE